MCNLYSQTKSQDAVRRLFAQMLDPKAGLADDTGNLRQLPAIWPDHTAPIIRRGAGGWRLTMARWGMPTPPKFLAGKRTDKGVTNIRNVGSPHWRRWLGVEHRCLVPFTSFSEIDGRPGAPSNSPVWFALAEERPLAFFAGLRTDWTSVRKLKEGQVTAELFAFLTCPPKRRGCAGSPQGDARYLDPARGMADLAYRTGAGGSGAPAPAAGRNAADRGGGGS